MLILWLRLKKVFVIYIAQFSLSLKTDYRDEIEGEYTGWYNSMYFNLNVT